jgi:hypothetical protein
MAVIMMKKRCKDEENKEDLGLPLPQQYRKRC